MKIKEFLKKVGMSEEEVLFQVSYERNRSIDFVRELRDQLQEDRDLLMNVKKDKEAIGDTTLFNVHTNLMARSYRSNPTISFQETKEGIDREVKMLNACLQEDFGSTYHKTLKYWKDWNKYWAGFCPVIRTGWDGIYKRNKFEAINPINVVLDPLGDYFSGNYKFVGMDKVFTMQELKAGDYENLDDIIPGETMEDGAIRYKRETQQEKDLLPQYKDTDEYEGYIHFDIFNGKKGWVIVANNGNLVIKAGLCLPGDKLQEKHPEAIKYPIAFYFWKPLPDIPCGDRPANYVRDVQITKSKLANLRLKKAQAELYPMYLYNKDYVKGSDLSFGFNKGIPISTGIDGPQVNLSNIVQPVQKDLRTDTTIQTEQLLDIQVEKSTGIGNIAQGSTPDRRETAKTNSLVMDSLDILISLNEEIDLIGEEQLVFQWFYGYYENFTEADKKLVLAASGTQTMPLQLSRKDFIIDGNLSLKMESSTATDMRKNRARINFAQFYSFLQADPNIATVSKQIALREYGEVSEIPVDKLELMVNKSPDQMQQEIENELLKMGQFVDIKPTDDHLTHLIALGDDLQNEAQILHKMAHMTAYSQSKAQSMSGGSNQIANIGMSQVGAESSSLSSNPM